MMIIYRAIFVQIQFLSRIKKLSSVVKTFLNVPLRHFSHLTSSFLFLQFFFLPIVRSYTARFSSVTNETKIKCKWKFIATGDRRRFLTFKYFINFLLLASVLVIPRSAWRVPVTIGVLWKEAKCLRNGTETSFRCRFFSIFSVNYHNILENKNFYSVEFVICILLMTNYVINFVYNIVK